MCGDAGGRSGKAIVGYSLEIRLSTSPSRHPVLLLRAANKRNGRGDLCKTMYDPAAM
jgi:hypothetical protein